MTSAATVFQECVHAREEGCELKERNQRFVIEYLIICHGFIRRIWHCRETDQRKPCVDRKKGI